VLVVTIGHSSATDLDGVFVFQREPEVRLKFADLMVQDSGRCQGHAPREVGVRAGVRIETNSGEK